MMDRPKDLRKLRGVMLDLDGTLYLGGSLFAETPAFLDELEARGIARLFLTNNSSRNTEQYLRKLQSFGIPAQEGEVLHSGWAAMHYLKSQTGHRRVYLLGTPGLCAEFEAEGFEVVNPTGAGLDGAPRIEPDVVVIGFDKTLTYERIERAAAYLDAGKPYIATHPDLTCPTETGFIPDTGSMIEMFATATGRRPTVIGKPEAPMVEAALRRLGTEPETTAMVGDRLTTDMRMAEKNGLISVLVLSGETKRHHLETLPTQPDFVLENIGEFTELLRQTGLAR